MSPSDDSASDGQAPIWASPPAHLGRSLSSSSSLFVSYLQITFVQRLVGICLSCHGSFFCLRPKASILTRSSFCYPPPYNRLSLNQTAVKQLMTPRTTIAKCKACCYRMAGCCQNGQKSDVVDLKRNFGDFEGAGEGGRGRFEVSVESTRPHPSRVSIGALYGVPLSVMTASVVSNSIITASNMATSIVPSFLAGGWLM